MTSSPPATLTVWTIDPSHALAEFSAKHMMITTVKGRVEKVSATIFIDESNISASRVEAELDAASISSNEERRDGHLKSADFLEVERFPKITFKSTRVDPVSSDRVHVVGDLTIRDVTREVVLDTELTGRGKTPHGLEIMGLSATTTINRKDFGLNWNVALEAGGFLVGDTVKLSLELEAIKQS